MKSLDTNLESRLGILEAENMKLRAALTEIDCPELDTLISMCVNGSDVHDILTALQGVARQALKPVLR